MYDWLLNGPVLLFLAGALLVTLQLALISMVLSSVIGVLLGLSRLSKNGLIHYPAVAYIETLRSLPLMLIIFFSFFGIQPLLGISVRPVEAGVIALSAYTGALIAEVVRAGVQSIERGFLEAADSQGFSRLQVAYLVRLPIALRRMTPALVTRFIGLVKGTSYLVVIGVPELMDRSRVVASRPPYDPIPVLVLVAFVYFVVNYSLSLVSRRLEVQQ